MAAVQVGTNCTYRFYESRRALVIHIVDDIEQSFLVPGEDFAFNQFVSRFEPASMLTTMSRTPGLLQYFGSKAYSMMT